PATTEMYTLSLHDALPIYLVGAEEDCLRGVALNQRIEGFHYILGAVYYQQERWTEAIQELEMVLQINPENQAAQALLVELRKARSEEHTSELQSRENLVCR